jgi:hypothetical protein
MPGVATRRRLLWLAALFALGGRPAAAQTVADVVRGYLEARGGAAKLRAVQGLRLTGTIEMGEVQAPFTLELARPNRMRTEFVVQGQTAVQAFDGTRAWQRPPLPGEPARLMGPDEAAEAREQADVDMSPLVDSAAKGFTVELAGRDKLPGAEAWKLLVRGREGPPRTLYVDVRTHLVIQTIDSRLVDGETVDIVTEVSDYRPVGGLMFPHHIEVGPKGKPEREQRLLVQHVELNPAFEAGHFAMPAARRATTPPAKP